MNQYFISLSNLKCFACCFSDPSFNIYIYIYPLETYEDWLLENLTL